MIGIADITDGPPPMRTLIDIPDKQIAALAIICEAEKLSQAEAIRQAIAAYLELKKVSPTVAFGVWKERSVDGLSYQEQARAEW
jgi:hypothetical protein